MKTGTPCWFLLFCPLFSPEIDPTVRSVECYTAPCRAGLSVTEAWGRAISVPGTPIVMVVAQ